MMCDATTLKIPRKGQRATKLCMVGVLSVSQWLGPCFPGLSHLFLGRMNPYSSWFYSRYFLFNLFFTCHSHMLSQCFMISLQPFCTQQNLYPSMDSVRSDCSFFELNISFCSFASIIHTYCNFIKRKTTAFLFFCSQPQGSQGFLLDLISFCTKATLAFHCPSPYHSSLMILDCLVGYSGRGLLGALKHPFSESATLFFSLS